MSDSKSKIVDVFPFIDEEGPLLARYLELESIVDEFIAVEASLTHSGRPNSQKLVDLLKRLHIPPQKFSSLFVPLSTADSPFERDRIQRNFAKDFLQEKLSESDWMIFGDVDEVPSKKSVQEAINKLARESQGIQFAHFAQEMCSTYFNNHEITSRLLSHMGEYPNVRRSERKWLGTVLLRFGALGDLDLSDLREPDRKNTGLRIYPGGWHFSSCGGPLELEATHRLVLKFENSSHVEFSHINRQMIPKLEQRLKRGRDVLGRRFVRFKFENPEHFLSASFSRDERLSNLIRS